MPKFILDELIGQARIDVLLTILLLFCVSVYFGGVRRCPAGPYGDCLHEIRAGVYQGTLLYNGIREKN